MPSIEQLPATTAGHKALLAWMRGFGRVLRIGVEGTGAYGADLPGGYATKAST